MNKLLYAVIFLLSLSGCALPVTKVNVSDLSRSESTRVVDLRPDNEKQLEIFSNLITSKAYGTFRISDSSIQPSPARLLQHRAFEKFGSSFAGDIKIYHLAAYSNLQASFRRSAVNAAIGGAVGAALAGAAPKNMASNQSKIIDKAEFAFKPNEEYRHALPSMGENPGGGGVHIIYIETEVNGKRVFSRTIGPFAATEGVNPPAAFLETAVMFHLAQY